MTLISQQGDVHVNLYDVSDEDAMENLFTKNPGVVIQVSGLHRHALCEYLGSEDIGYAKIGCPTPRERKIVMKRNEQWHESDIDALRKA